jgi:hypothetical protein
MNTFKRLGVSVLLLLTFGCTTVPTYTNGQYSGSVPTWDAGKIASAGTCAIAGGLASSVLYGNPLGGAALGAAVCGAMPSYSQPIYVPPPPQYQVVQPPPPYQENYYGNGYQYQQPQPYQQNYYGNGYPPQQQQYQYQQQPQYVPQKSCKMQYDESMRINNMKYEESTSALEQFYRDTGNKTDYDRLSGELQQWYPQAVKNAGATYANCIGQMR